MGIYLPIAEISVNAFVLLAMGGCVRYVPRPLEPASHPAIHRARRLDDPRLLDWVGRWAGRPASAPLAMRRETAD